MNVRRRCVLVLCGTAFGATCLVGQENPDTAFRSFRTPASPAFILLGAAPTAVERPGTPQSLVASLVAALKDKNFPPKRYALEFAPYWLTRHRRLTFEQYASPGFWQSIKQTLSISVATANIPAPDSGTVLGFGIRAGYLGNRDPTLVNSLRDSIIAVQQQMLRTEDSARTGRLTERARRMAMRMQHLLRSERLGWTIEGAAAALMDFPGDVAANGKIARAAIWVTSGYRLTKPRANLLTVVRLTRDERTAPRQSFLDLGGRIVVDQEDLSLSGEYVFRSISATGFSSHTYQLSAAAEYQVSTDIFITAALGRGPEEGGAGSSRLIAQIGVDFGLGPLPLLVTRPAR